MLDMLTTFVLRAIAVIVLSLIFPPLGFLLLVAYVIGAIENMVSKEKAAAAAREEANKDNHEDEAVNQH